MVKHLPHYPKVKCLVHLLPLAQESSNKGAGLTTGSGTMVKHLPHYPKIKSLSPPTAAQARKMVIKVLD
jgi:hypothetical protein